jgi:DNA-binding MarR family transcriptional regulator
MPRALTSRRMQSEASPGDEGPSETQLGTLTDESIGYLSRYAYRAFVRVLAGRLAPHGIATGEWAALRVLWQSENLSQVELASRMKVEKASLTAVLNKMQKKGLIEKTTGSDDRRKVKISLTARGRKMRDEILPYGSMISDMATDGMRTDEIAQLRALLLKLIRHVENAAD